VRAVKGLRYATSSGQFGMDIRPDEICITYDSGIQGAFGARHIHTATVLLVIDLIRRFAGAGWDPIRVELDQPKDSDTKDLEGIFRAPVIFNCRYPAIAFEPQLLDRPNTRAANTRDQLTFGDLRQMVQSRPQNSARASVEAVLRLRLMEGQMDIEGTAQNLDVGPRTLQRRLQREGASYRDLVEAARRERASALLIETSERVADIAVALGYSSPSHFVRAFRRWTGNTPNTFRQRQA
jgi:AraC-like DNA-binding protein